MKKGKNISLKELKKFIDSAKEKNKKNDDEFKPERLEKMRIDITRNTNTYYFS